MSFRKSLLFSPIIFIVLLSATSISGAQTQFHLRLGDSGVLFGEKFLITLNDVIYWIAGICLGFIFAVTYVLLLDYNTLKKEQEKLRLKLREAEEASHRVSILPLEVGNITAATAPTGPRDREGRLVGSKKYPTQVEERVLKAIHTEPDNYFDNPVQNYRRARLVGPSRRVPTSMENRVLKRVDEEPGNSFEN